MNLFHKSKLLVISSLLFSTVSYAQNRSVYPAPYGALPTTAQLKWQETEMYCIIHFTPTTFQNKEWGYGDADPAIFNPSGFDARQIVAAAKSGGFKGIVYVAKHHDGFALWPTKTSAYNISESPWKNGKGDMVREFQLAARQEGLKFGIYCSPWDRNNTNYGTPQYLTVYRNQLKELYTNYGDLFMSWHDGANGGDGNYGGKKEKRKVDQSVYYDWMNTWSVTRKLQPGAAIFSDIGPDVRWVGNEKGIAPETSWSTITLKGINGKPAMPGFLDDANLGSGTRGGNTWIPFEGDVALRPGWFYHPEQDGQLKTTEQLFHIYCNSVGHGGALDLGLSPTTQGVLHPNDVAALAAFGKFLKDAFKTDLAREAKISLSNIRGGAADLFGAGKLTDDDRYSYWATDDAVHQATATLDFKTPVKFSLIRLRENIKLGQRIDSVKIEMLKEGRWTSLSTVTSIGANRIVRLPAAETAAKVRIHIYAPVSIALSEIGLFLEPEMKNTMDLKVEAAYPRTSWKAAADGAGDTDAGKAIDGKESTSLIFKAGGALTIDFGSSLSFSAVGYLPAQDGISAGAIEKYTLLASADGQNWENIAEGELANIKANPILQRIALQRTVQGRYLKLVSRQAVPGKDGSLTARAAEITVYR